MASFAPNPPPRRPRPRPHGDGTGAPGPHASGITLVELVLGLAVTAMVGGAVAAVALAVGEGWQQANDASAEFLSTQRATAYLQDALRNAVAIGDYDPGDADAANPVAPASVIFWREDRKRGGASDQKMQVDELAVIEYRPLNRQILLYEARYPDADAATANAAPLPPSFLDEPDAAAQFKAKPYVQARVIAGKAAAGPNVQDGEIVGARFHVMGRNRPSQRPTFEFVLKVKQKNRTVYSYGATALRPATTQPGGQ